MWVGVLGALHVVVDGRAVEVGGVRLRALLVRLAIDAGRPVGVGALTAAVWPDRAPADERHALQALVSRLRGRLGRQLSAVHGGYELDIAADAVDVTVFERSVRDGCQALHEGRLEEAARQLREALELWRGTPLADAGEAEYAVAVIARLDALRLDALEARIEAELRLGHHRHLVAELQQLTTETPSRERLQTLLVRALHADGRSAEALATYEAYRNQLADDLGADPGEELRAAHLAALRGTGPDEEPRAAHPTALRGTGSDGEPRITEPHGVGSLAWSAGRGGNLRAPLTSFVGRSRELEQIAQALRTCRLVTLVGPGGVGKTRLATVAGADHEQATTRPTWLVDLAPVTDPDDVARAVLDTVGLPGSPAGMPPTSHRLVDALAGVDALLLLDNCEHLLDQVAELAEELLGRCPSIRVLATSREPLRASGETLCEVAPLPVDGTDPPAIRLFRDRASAVQPGFELSADDVTTVAEVCRRLDGLPLAIELAAARLRSMPLHQLAERLDDRFRLLSTGRRTAPARHRTLRAVVAWSWDLLDAETRDAAERLAVFPATFTSAAAGHVGVAQDLLDSLVDKSLLQLAERTTPRYQMSSTVREYGLERLTESGRRPGAERAHLAYVLDLAERAEPWLRGPGQLPWLVSLREERENLSAAQRFALGSGDVTAAVRLAAALGLFWTFHGDHPEAAARLRTVLDAAASATARPPADALLAVTATYLVNALLAGLGAEARTVAQPPAASPASEPMAALVASVLATVDAPIAAAELLQPHLDHPDPWQRGVLWLFRAFLLGGQGGWQEMSADLSVAAEAFRAAGERWGLATALTYLGMMHSALGEHQAAVTELGEAAVLAGELGYDEPQRVWLAIAKLHTGDVPTARAELDAFAAQATSADWAALARLRLADVARHEGDLAEATRQLDIARELLGPRATGDPMFLAGTGSLAVAHGQLTSAATQLRDALTLAVQMPDLPMAALIGVAAAQLAHRRGEPSAAAEALGAADAVRGTTDPTDVDTARLGEALRAELGEPAYADAHHRGAHLTQPAALARLGHLLETPG